MNVNIEESWKTLLQKEFDKPYFEEIKKKVKNEYRTQKVCPKPQDIFKAFNLAPVDSLKVIILGQDPYHTPNVADGLSFSTNTANKVPPSLQNIYKEIMKEFDLDSYEFYNNPNLERWAKQGVLLLNNTLTVREGQANSHKNIGWNVFTDEVIKTISKEKKNLVFMLWGKFAQSKEGLIDEKNTHLILKSTHPSPFSADRGFFGNNHFKECNVFLKKNNLSEIYW